MMKLLLISARDELMPKMTKEPDKISVHRPATHSEQHAYNPR